MGSIPGRLKVSGQHRSEETPQRWRAIGDPVSDLIGSGIEPQTSRSNALNGHAKRSLEHDIVLMMVMIYYGIS